MKLQGPVEVEMKVSITDGNGTDGVVTIGFGKGSFPSPERMREWLDRLDNGDLPDGFRTMTKREYWDSLMPPMVSEDEDGEVYTSRYAVPGGETDWDE